VIEQAYRVGEALGLAVWTQDEAGPSQAIPPPGPAWRPEGQPVRHPHEYVRGGTAKLLPVFRPATGELRAQPVRAAPNAVLHPWLRQEWAAILAAQPALPDDVAAARAQRAFWDVWRRGLATPVPLPAVLPPLRALRVWVVWVVWDNLAGHKTPAMVDWLVARGVLPLYTPLGGSWLNMAESAQRIIGRRALDGQHPHSAEEVMAWLAATVRGWNAAPTVFAWGGKRQQRRWRARQRRHARQTLHALGGSGAVTHRPVPRLRRHRPPFERLCA
jgi:hypothetical protein